ncbi:TPA: hypothetical protein MHP96_24565 [Klebsiella quasipneumoniae subsp. similipneumoniae]|nr:hypothetical protein CI612_24765 [Klebsiella quasipneumoniae subsp. similipneumoniae]HBX1731157.1 hypothetical protein [Klebsiella quasipneumoniae subsp. similipneumoniae]HBY1932881.1 hypothetical protein [Klebsiella pneumoniae]
MDSMAVFNGSDHRTFLRGKGRRLVENRKPKARYIVGIPHGRVLYEGNLRFAAWWSWLFNCRQAVAFDRRSWVINPSYWIAGDIPNENYFNMEGHRCAKN